MKQEEPTIKDVLDAISEFAGNTDQRFDNLENRLSNLEERTEKIKIKLPGLVTKDYLDDKLGDLRGEMIGLMRRLCPWGFEKQPIK